ncbi:hypothetical protein O3P69_019813 [Scylla paramamosain]|uniref:Sidestep protein n=1 Tax=Scylla paramamosain TaxID=85552 RepID=A0AAW0SI02_SCYPA
MAGEEDVLSQCRRESQDPGYVGGGSEVSTARLLVNVTREHNGTRVACVATNPTRPESPLTNTTTLTVHCRSSRLEHSVINVPDIPITPIPVHGVRFSARINPPRVTATMGQNVDPSRLKVKDDVYFDCIVSANPHASPITWYHEGRVLIQNLTGGVILAGNSLALQSVKRQQAGRYTCSATNPLGTATSDPVTLRIKYSPVCLSSPTAYFIYDKPINITCTVSSYPAVSVIMWQWNNSNEVIETPSLEVSHDEASAQMTVHPLQSQEDRALSCWAVNEMGKQTQTCGFSVKVAKTPLPLSSCRLANITASSLSLTCQRPDVDAAGTIHYRAEVYFENRTLFANVTSERPNFNVSCLDAETSYQIKVYVTHGPITSQPVVVSAYTSRTSRTPPGESC